MFESGAFVIKFSDSIYDDHHLYAAEVLAHNVAGDEGLPLHARLADSSSPWSAAFAESPMHRMTHNSRVALSQYFTTSVRLPPHVARKLAECVVAATIMHSADHYYIDKFTPFDSVSTELNFDFTLFRLTLVPPNVFPFASMLCRQNLDDPVCKILFESCVSVDPTFANNRLFYAPCS